MNITDDRIKFLRLLSEKYRSRQQVCTEIINLQAILNMRLFLTSSITLRELSVKR